MRRKRNSMIGYAIGLFFIALAGCSNSTDNTEKEIQKLISKMTLEEKIAMLHGNSKFSSAGCERLGIPEFNYADGPHGVREELERDSWKPAGWTNDSATYFPTGTAMAATWNPEMAYQIGLGLGLESRARDKDMLLGPAVNLQRTPVCGRNYEYLTEDPHLNARLTVEYIKGVQSCDVAACVKHFAANNQELNRGTVDVELSDRAMYELYFPAFKAAVVEAGALGVMGAYNRFRGEYCCENEFLLKKTLRTDWGFEGIVVSDWAAVHNTHKAALAGLDVEMGTNDKYNTFFMADPLLEAVKKGEIEEKVIDEKVANILRVLYKIKAFTPEKQQKGEINSDRNHQIAYQVASEAIVLLKNENNALPLQREKIKTIAVIGDNATRKLADGGFGAGVKAQYEITPLQGLKNRLGETSEVVFVQGFEKRSKPRYKNEIEREIDLAEADKPDYKLIAAAVEVAKKSDIAIIMAGLNHDYDTEASDRLSLKLPYGQDSLIAAVCRANPNTVVVIIAGSPVDVKVSLDKAPAVVWGWLNGSEGGNALADVLMGTVNPSGKMPFTVPARLEDSPVHALGSYPGDTKVVYTEDVFIGYRWFDTKNIEPLVPFGFGLSYTSFEYSNLKTDKENYKAGDVATIEFTLKNTGTKAGSEVAQLYVSDPVASVERPLQELRAFEKVVLQPGEEKRVSMKVPVTNFAFYDEAQAGWNLEPGEFILNLGSSSRNLKLKQSIQIQ